MNLNTNEVDTLDSDDSNAAESVEEKNGPALSAVSWRSLQIFHIT